MELEGFQIDGKVEAVLTMRGHESIVTILEKYIHLEIGQGIHGDKHSGARRIGTREKELVSAGFAKGTPIDNYREVSVVSAEEVAAIAKALNLPDSIPNGFLYGFFGENLVLSGIPDLSQIPVGTKLIFTNARNQQKSAVEVRQENQPCIRTGEAIQDQFPEFPDLAAKFPEAAYGKRGLVGSVFASGNIRAGDSVTALVPSRRTYPPQDSGR